VATFISNSPAETEAFAREFAREIKKGDVVALQGELGSGKTQFVKGFVAGMDSKAEVTSPTFTLIHEYAGGRLPVYHIDLFRLENRQAAERLGLDEYFSADGVSIVEWADKFPELIPRNAQWISFELQSDRQRLINVQGAAVSRPPSISNGGLKAAAPRSADENPRS
jgi:tRNA threonylcarbamoyladenosine biosynthesis protein TsaE